MKPILLILLSILITGCASKRSVSETRTSDTERAIRDTVRLVSHQRDTLILRDSVVRTERADGCTIRIETERWRTRTETRTLRDTVSRTLRDTVRVATTETRQTSKTTSPMLNFLLLLTFTIAPVVILWELIRFFNNRDKNEE